jgi:hypothetical protein
MVSQLCIAQDDGAVPRSPMPPVVKGLSSGNTALPSNALATGAPRTSASWVTSTRAESAPCPVRTATREPSVEDGGGGLQLIRRRRRQGRLTGRQA